MAKNIRQLLEQRYPPGEYVIMGEVSDASGFNRTRSLDWMVAAIWESRGLSITGIEQKSHRGDWIKELKNPKKQENHFKYCDYFYLFTTEDNVAKLEEIPDTWGWIHLSGERIKEMKKAPKLEAKQITRTFLIAMLRRAASKRGYIPESEIESVIQERVANATSEILRHDNAARELNRLKKAIEKFQNESGIDDIERGWYYYYGAGKDAPAIVGKAVKALLQYGIDGVKEKLINMKQVAERLVKDIDREVKQISNGQP